MDWRAGAASVSIIILAEGLFTLFSASIAPSPVAIAVPFHSCPKVRHVRGTGQAVQVLDRRLGVGGVVRV